MMMMKRMAMVLTVIALAPFFIGGGANPGCTNPSGCAAPSTIGPVVGGTIVVDTHTNGVTTVFGFDKAGYGSIRLQKGNRTAGTIFKLPSTFLVGLGCDVTKTSQRFGVGNVAPDFNGLRVWLDPIIVDQLLMSLGLPVGGKPVITDFNNVVCTIDAENPGPLFDGSKPGILSADIVVQFVK